MPARPPRPTAPKTTKPAKAKAAKPAKVKAAKPAKVKAAKPAKAKTTKAAKAAQPAKVRAAKPAKVKAAKPAKAPRGGTTTKRPATIDAYLAGVAPEPRAALEALRATIRKIVPSAEECISYSMPAFRLNGRVVAGFLATSTGCSYFPFSGTTLATLADQLAGRSQTKSALHFTPAAPLPERLVKALLRARIAEG